MDRQADEEVDGKNDKGRNGLTGSGKADGGGDEYTDGRTNR